MFFPSRCILNVSFCMFHYILLSSLCYLNNSGTLIILPHPPPPTLHPLPSFSFFHFEIMRQKDVNESSALSAPFVSLHFLKIYNFYHKIKLFARVVNEFCFLFLVSILLLFTQFIVCKFSFNVVSF